MNRGTSVTDGDGIYFTKGPESITRRPVVSNPMGSLYIPRWDLFL